MSDAPMALPEIEKLHVGEAGSWILYDVANTVYAATISFVFSVYIAMNFGDAGTQGVGITQTVSMVLTGLSVPFLAALADRTGKARLYLIIMSLVCILAMGAFAIDAPLAMLLLFFGLANFAYQGALVFYNSLLPSVAPISKAGLVSGLGTGLGYIGTLLVLVFALMIQEKEGTQTAFLACAILFTLLALPCFLFVRERRVAYREKVSKELLGERWRALTSTIKGLPKDRKVMFFLIGNFWCVDVLNTALLFFAPYSLAVWGGHHFGVFGMDIDLRYYVEAGSDAMMLPGQKSFLMVIGLLLNGLALFFGVMLGVLADKWGALRALRLSAFFLMLAIIAGFLFAGRGLESDQIAKLKEQAKSSVVQDSSSLAQQADWQDLAQELDVSVSPVSAEFVAEREKMRAKSTIPQSVMVPQLVIERETKRPWFPMLFVLSLGVLGGLGLAGIWTAGRKVLMEIAPREKLGEYFGLYGITTKVSVFGSTTFALIMTSANARSALLFQALPLALGIYFLSKLHAVNKSNAARL